MAKAIACKLAAAEAVLGPHLEMEPGPALKAFGGEVQVDGVGPVGHVPYLGVSTCVWPSRTPDRSFHAAPVWTPHLHNRLLSEKPVAPMICPITCTSAIALKVPNG